MMIDPNGVLIWLAQITHSIAPCGNESGLKICGSGKWHAVFILSSEPAIKMSTAIEWSR